MTKYKLSLNKQTWTHINIATIMRLQYVYTIGYVIQGAWHIWNNASTTMLILSLFFIAITFCTEIFYRKYKGEQNEQDKME